MIGAVTLRGVTIGARPPYWFERAPIGLAPGQYRRQRAIPVGVNGSRPTGPDLLPARVVTLDVNVGNDSDDPATTWGLFQDLLGAWAPVDVGTVDMSMTMAGSDLVLRGRPIDAVDDLELLPEGIARVRLSFEATDPRWYSSTMSSILLGLTEGGGLEFPLTFPLTFGAGSDNDGSAFNAGTAPAPWTAAILGPVTNPVLTLGSTGEAVVITGVVAPGETLLIDSASRSVLLDGSPRSSWIALTSRWWELAAGTNTVRFRAAAGTGVCTFSWRSAWL